VYLDSWYHIAMAATLGGGLLPAPAGRAAYHGHGAALRALLGM
jgi:hypothetical protein